MPELDEISRALLDAQRKAESLFAAVIDLGVIAPGKLESEVSAEIHALAQSRFGVSRHWHKRIARAGPNTVLTYHDDPKDLRIHGNELRLRARDASGRQRHWILEIHFIDRARQIGGFFEELLTV
jgi:hypothetical protein